MERFGPWAILLLTLSCSPFPDSVSQPRSSAGGVILITVDTLRADHLSSYGYRAIRTTHLDRLADQGILFDQAIAPAPLTLPSHASILTGRHPASHGARDNTGFVLPETQRTLAEILHEAGYATAAFVGSYVLDSRTGLDQGFGHYDDQIGEGQPGLLNLELLERPAQEVVNAAQTWIASRDDSRFFVWLHLFDPHAPYAPPRRYPGATPYDQEVLYTDEVLGRFFEFLKRNNLFEDSVIVLTADHGEGLGEHGEDTHGMFLYDSTLHVPLILKLPGQEAAGTRVTEQVRLIDLAPTIVSLLELPPAMEFEGISLYPSWRGEPFSAGPAYSEALLPLLNYGWSDVYSLRADGYKLIDAPRPELYALMSDPEETRNLFSQLPDVAGRLRERLQLLAARAPVTGTTEAYRQPDPETIRRLRALGYLSSGGLHADQPTRDPIFSLKQRLGPRLTDPKEKIGVFNRVWRAQSALVDGDFDLALETIEPVLHEDDSVFMGHSIRALTLLELNRSDAALSSLQRAVDLRPEDPGAVLYLGIAAFRSGQLKTAVDAFERCLQLEPENDSASNNLAAAYAQLGDLEKAVSMFRSMASRNSQDPAPHLNLGVIYMKQKQYEQALSSFEEALRRQPDLAEAHNNIGVIHLNSGSPGRAVAPLSRAVELNPRYVNAHRNLARAYQLLGKEEEARRSLAAAEALENH